jgi:putative ABC transport system permease protein
MPYSLNIIWHERLRYLPAILAVAFSALLIALQSGLLLGLFNLMSIPIDHADADIWMGYPDVLSVDLGRAIPESWMSRLAKHPEVERVEPCVLGFAGWRSVRTGKVEVCTVIGSRLGDRSLGAVDRLGAEQRAWLAEPGTIVVDRAELGRLGVKGVGDLAEVNGRLVRVVGLVEGLKSLGGPYVFCSVDTARSLLRLPPDQTTYLLAGCHNPADADRVVQRLRQRYGSAQHKQISVFTKPDFSIHSRVHWLTKTKAGLALGLAAVLGLLVGAVVTSQTLYAATAASLPQYAVYLAQGISRTRIAWIVVVIAFWVGVAGIVVAFPVVLLLAELFDAMGTPVKLPLWLLASTAVITMSMALLSGLAALRLIWRSRLTDYLRGA